MSDQAKKQKRDQLSHRIHCALRMAVAGEAGHASGRLLCEPFNPGSAEKIEQLASSVLHLVLIRLLATAPEVVVDQLITDIDTEVVAQGVFNVGGARQAMLKQATFGPLQQPDEALGGVTDGTDA